MTTPPALIIFTGPQGCGKSTLADFLSRGLDAYSIEDLTNKRVDIPCDSQGNPPPYTIATTQLTIPELTDIKLSWTTKGFVVIIYELNRVLI